MKVTAATHELIQKYVAQLEKFADRIWYAPLIGLLAALDCFLLIIPNDGILIASCMLTPKRWALYGITISVGSTIGAVVLSYVAGTQGLPWVQEFFPGIEASWAWVWTEDFFAKYGLLVVFLVSASPLMQQPIIVLSALSHTPLMTLAVVFFSGRILKFMLLAYISSHSPQYLKKIWGIKSELKDVGVKID
jgi:membrane protein YqaA with SNARE-associated domain